MGFTPLEGVPMATRPGSVDPGALLYMLRHHLTLAGLDEMLERDSGLAGLSGLSGDVRELERADDPSARLALDVFTYRTRLYRRRTARSVSPSSKPARTW
jgi:acetate kinase